MNATTNGSDKKTHEKHEKLARKIVKKDLKDVEGDDDNDETKQQVKIKKKQRVSGPSVEGKKIHKVKVEIDENGNVIQPSFSKKIAKKDMKSKNRK